MSKIKEIFIIFSIIYLIFFINFVSTFYDFSITYNDDNHSQTFSYLYSGFLKEEPPSFFNEKEIAHMKDVKLWFNILNILFGMSLILIFYFYNEKIISYKHFFISALAIILFLFISFIFSRIFSFSTLWNVFHYVFFPQGNWRFPFDSTIIILFPESFFQEFISQFFISLLISSSFVIVLSIFMHFLYSLQASHRKR